MLLEVLVQIFLEVFGEILLEIGLAVVKEAFGRENRGTALATVGYLGLGACVGAASLLAFPGRIMNHRPIPGISLLVAPLVGGAVMQWWGGFRRAHSHVTTNLATFYGGAALLFGYALVRLIWAR